MVLANKKLEFSQTVKGATGVLVPPLVNIYVGGKIWECAQAIFGSLDCSSDEYCVANYSFVLVDKYRLISDSYVDVVVANSNYLLWTNRNLVTDTLPFVTKVMSPNVFDTANNSLLENNIGSRVDVSDGYALGRFIAFSYLDILGRPVDEVGFENYFRLLISSELSIVEFRLALLESNEFFNNLKQGFFTPGRLSRFSGFMSIVDSTLHKMNGEAVKVIPRVVREREPDNVIGGNSEDGVFVILNRGTSYHDAWIGDDVELGLISDRYPARVRLHFWRPDCDYSGFQISPINLNFQIFYEHQQYIVEAYVNPGEVSSLALSVANKFIPDNEDVRSLGGVISEIEVYSFY